ncbi:Pre-mRNA-splicing factor of RES complex-domain-containing protein [Kalaharituber pfeilii]|nr:Pre-mRNA-splicing factor of RES complex-domain-containing protein [Kalaharituber pfeilii]
MSLADYLAKKYLTKDPASGDKKKKKKRKKDDGIVIADDDAMGWDEGKKGSEDEEETMIVRDGHSAEFRRVSRSNWISAAATSNALGARGAADDHGAAEAAAVLAQASREQAAKDLDDEGPTIVDSADTPKMESGARAGLQTGAQVTADLARKREAELAKFRNADPIAAGKGQETIYRDASGRVVNIAMARAEARRQADEAARKEAEQKLRLKGDVQILQQEARKKELEEAKFKMLARYKDDVELNEELKEQIRWDDPVMQFMERKKLEKSRTGKPLYQGPWPPNRYGIRPGHRWDGVDRGNGFEKKWFQARGAKQSRKELEYAWEMDE